MVNGSGKDGEEGQPGDSGAGNSTVNGEAVWDLSDPVGQSVFLGRFKDMEKAGFSVTVDDPHGVGQVGGEVDDDGR